MIYLKLILIKNQQRFMSLNDLKHCIKIKSGTPRAGAASRRTLQMILQLSTTEKELDKAEARHQCLKSAALSPLKNKLFKHSITKPQRRISSFDQYLIRAEPQVNPPPKLSNKHTSPRLIRPSSIASHMANGIEALDVLP